MLAKLASDIAKAIEQNKEKGTKSYDTTAKVVRVEGSTAWVHIPGGVDETPVKLTIAAETGDTVQVRVAGGRAWLTGNTTAPPTDDRTAKAATKTATTALKTARSVEKRADAGEFDGKDGKDGENGENGAYIVKLTEEHCLSDSNTELKNATAWSTTLPEYVEGKYYWYRTKAEMSDGSTKYSDPVYDGTAQIAAEAGVVSETASNASNTAKEIAENAKNAADGAQETANETAKHFWYDSSGAHVSDVEGSVNSGNSQTIAPNGTVMMRNGKVVTSWTGSSSSNAALNFYDCSNATAQDSNLMASYTRAGVNLYVQNKKRMALVPDGISFYKSDGSTAMASYTSSGISFADDIPFTVGNSSSYLKWIKESNTWKLKLVADVIEMGGKSLLTTDNDTSQYMTFSTTDGLRLYGGDKNSSTYNTSYTQIKSTGIDLVSSGSNLAHLGYDSGVNESGGTSKAPYYTFGTRAEGSKIGNYSVAEGVKTTASNYTAHAEGRNTVASGRYSHAEGQNTQATGSYSHAAGCGTIAAGACQTVVGQYNVSDTNSLFIVGMGVSEGDGRMNAMKVSSEGQLTIEGHSTPIGWTRLIPQTSEITAPTSSSVRVATVTIPEGTWVVTCGVRFPGKDVDGKNATTGVRRINFCDTSGATYLHEQIPAGSTNAAIQMNLTRIIKVDNEDGITYFLNAWHNNGSTLTLPQSSNNDETASQYVKIVRIA